MKNLNVDRVGRGVIFIIVLWVIIGWGINAFEGLDGQQAADKLLALSFEYIPWAIFILIIVLFLRAYQKKKDKKKAGEKDLWEKEAKEMAKDYYKDRDSNLKERKDTKDYD